MVLRRHVAALDALRKPNLLDGAQEVDPADRAQVEPQRIEARLDREVDVNFLRRPPAIRLVGVASLAWHRLAFGRKQIDALLAEVGAQLAQLLLCHLDLLERAHQLVEGHEAAIASGLEERPELFTVGERSLTGPIYEKGTLFLWIQPSPPVAGVLTANRRPRIQCGPAAVRVRPKATIHPIPAYR